VQIPSAVRALAEARLPTERARGSIRKLDVTTLETAAMTVLRYPAILVGMLAVAGAQSAHAEDLTGYSGARLYHRFCAACHGDKGRGDGVVAPFFKLAPPDLTQITKRHGGVFPTEKITQIIDGREAVAPHGAREMPVWGLELYLADPKNPKSKKQVDDMIARLVEHLHSIQEK
jgi:mono/diheme cytochrome c family protein